MIPHKTNPTIKIALFVISAAALGAGIFLLLNRDKNSPTTADVENNGPSISEVAAETLGPGVQNVGTNGTLTMTFPEALTKQEIEENLNVPEGLEGVQTWNDNTLTFVPAAPLAIGEKYTFNLNKKGLFASYQDVEYTFQVTGTPKLSAHYPQAAAEDIAVESYIQLVFDRPMTALSTLQGDGALNQFKDWPVKFEPAINGDWHWLGTTTAEFRPAEKLKQATTYKVNIPAGIVTINGEKTDKDFSYSFSTTRPEITDTEPRNEFKLAGPTTDIIVRFNQEIDLEKAKTHVEFRQLNGKSNTIPLNFSLKYPQVEDEEGKKVENKNAFQLVPESPLVRKSEYMVSINDGFQAKEGNLAVKSNFIFKFKTVDDFKVEKVKLDPYGSLGINFTSPIDNKTLSKNITITPKVEGWEGEELESENTSWGDNTSLTLYPPFKPSTEYTIKFSDKIKDSFGEALNGEREFKITTPALEPRLDLLTEEDFGLFEKDFPPLFPFKTVNMKTMQAEFAALNLDQFIEIQKNKRLKQDYPVLSGYANYEKFPLNPKNKLNEWELQNIDLKGRIAATEGKDFYALRLTAPYTNREGKPDTYIKDHYFSLTNIGLTLKYSASKTLVWAIDLKTGEPVTDAAITFYSNDAKKIIEGKTDAKGFLEADFDIKSFKTENNSGDPLFWVTAEKGEDFAFISSQWSSGMRAWNFGLNEDIHGTNDGDFMMDAYLYTERNLYRAGDTVNFKGIVRLRDKNGQIKIAPNTYKANVEVTDAKGNQVFKKTFDLNDYGSFFGDLPISPDATLGNYRMNVSLTPEIGIRNNYLGHSFAVLAFRKPEYEVEINPEAENYFTGDNVAFNINAKYFFGAPMKDATVKWAAISEDYWFNRYTDGWYSFSLEENWCWFDCSYQKETLTEGTGKLDDQGKLKIDFPVNLDDKPTSQSIQLEASITDSNNQTVGSTAVVPVHKSSVYVGVNSESYAVSQGEKAKINVVTVDPNGKKMANQSVEMKLMERQWNTIKKKSIDGAYYYENEPKDTLVKTVSVKTGQDGKGSHEFVIEKGGSYVVFVEAKDSKGRSAKASTSLYVFSNTYINWPHENNDRIDVLADLPEYKVGDTAKILIKTPYQGKGVKALITVERENIMTKTLIDVESNAQAFEVPITKEMIPNAFVSAVIIKPRQGQTFDDNGQDTGGPAFKMGYVKLNVETAPKKMKVEVKTNKETYLPRETVEVSLKTMDFTGKPTEAEVSLGVVDLSLISLLGFRMPDLVEVFYQERPLGVKTSQMLSHLIRTFKPGSKGGGGDGDDESRTNFKDTAFWKADIRTDENGVANVEFELPDNLTTWQLLAIAQTKDHLYGADVHEIVETKQVVLRPVMPRFAVKGDEIQAGAIVHNFTDKTQDFVVTMDGAGFTQKKKEQKITLKPKAQEKVIFPITVTADKELSFHFKAQSKGGEDELEQKVPVYLFGTPQAVATSGFTEDKMVENVYLPSSDEAKNGVVQMTVSPTVASYLSGGLEYLSTYPYGCAEQTVSSFLGSVTLATLQNFEVFEWVDKKELEKKVISGLQQIYKFLRFDGGFGFWEGSDKSYPYLSAYILHSLNLTEKAGYSVDKKVMSRTSDYLKGILRDQKLTEQVTLAERAYMIYVLAETGGRDENLSNNLFEKRAELPVFAKAYLAMSYPQDNANGKVVVDDMLKEIKISARGSHFEEKDEQLWRFAMNTNENTTALALQALLKFQPKNEQIHKIVRYLLAVRQNGHWDTTQSTINSLMAFAEFLKSTNELEGNFKASVTVNGTSVYSETFAKENILTKETVKKMFEELEKGKLNTFEFAKEGDGRLYYDMTLNYFLTLDKIAAMDQGIGITKELLQVGTDKDEEAKPAKDLVAGETYKIKLRMTVPQDRLFVAVDSPLPAGFEAVDFNFKTNEGVLEEEVEGNWKNSWHFNHIEYRDDRVVLFSDYLPAGVYEYEYLVRATTPGRFKYRPTHISEMYYPEVFGQTEGDWIEIK